MLDKFVKLYDDADAQYDSGNFELAFIAFLELAEVGDDSAMDRVASMYDTGEGTEYSLGKAVFWYKKAIDQGSFISCHNLGVTYRRHGDMVDAKYWFEQSIAHENFDSALDLAKLLMICDDKREQVIAYLMMCIEDKGGYVHRINEAEALLRQYSLSHITPLRCCPP